MQTWNCGSNLSFFLSLWLVTPRILTVIYLFIFSLKRCFAASLTLGYFSQSMKLLYDFVLAAIRVCGFFPECH